MASENVDYCPKTADHVHVINLATLTITHDDHGAYVAVNCEACGRSGCLAKIDVDSPVDW